MPISLTLIPFDHFQNMSSGGIGPDLILTLCLNRIGSTSALVSLFRELLSFGLRSGCQGEKLRAKEIPGKSFVQGEPLLVCSVPILRRVFPTSSRQAFAKNFPQGDRRNRKEHFEENRRN